MKVVRHSKSKNVKINRNAYEGYILQTKLQRPRNVRW